MTATRRRARKAWAFLAAESFAQRVVRHPPSVVWPLLVDPAMWQLGGFVFGFDVEDPPESVGPVRVLFWPNGDGSISALPFRVSVNEPERRFVATFASEHTREWTLDLRVRSARRGARFECRARIRQPSLRRRFRTQRNWDRRVSAWAFGVAVVLTGQWERPSATLTPERALALAAPRPADREPVTASAEVEIALPPGRVWDLMWDPATQLPAADTMLYGGQVPGTPTQAVGEIQYFLSEVDGHLHASLVVVTAIERGRSATTAALKYPAETDHLVEPSETEGHTRLRISFRCWYDVAQDDLQRQCDAAVEMQGRLIAAAADPLGQDHRAVSPSADAEKGC